MKITQEMRLKEGMDLGMFLLQEFMSRNLYLASFQKLFPVAAPMYIPQTIAKLMKKSAKVPSNRDLLISIAVCGG